MNELKGLIKVNKPAGWTSFDAVNKIRSILSAHILDKTGQKTRLKVGHCGTLDPFATGLLLIGYGSCTKQLTKLTKLDKTYQATAKLGLSSSTGDPEGEITSVSADKPMEKRIKEVLKEFVGTIDQTPPAYSAIKINGKRAYDLARQGKQVEIKPRRVTINNIKLIKYNYPELEIEVSVSSGTYIRSLAQDIGDKLGCGAYLTELKRTIIGEFELDGAIDPSSTDASAIINSSISCQGSHKQSVQ